jgi:hypothetical protein
MARECGPPSRVLQAAQNQGEIFFFGKADIAWVARIRGP